MSEHVDDLVADVYPPQNASSLAQAAQVLAAAGVNYSTFKSIKRAELASWVVFRDA